MPFYDRIAEDDALLLELRSLTALVLEAATRGDSASAATLRRRRAACREALCAAHQQVTRAA